MTNKKVRGVIQSDKPTNETVTSIDDLGKAIKYKRTKQNLSIHKAAALLNISDKTLQSIESGKDSKFSTVLKVSKMLGLKLKIEGL